MLLVDGLLEGWAIKTIIGKFLSSFEPRLVCRLFRKGGGCHLEHLDVSGCKNITDKTLVKLSSALVKKTSGISDIEDSGCECLSKCGCTKRNKEYLLPQKGLVYLGLSGCYQITDTGLR